MKTWKTKSGYKIKRVLSGRSNVFLLTNGKKNILIDTSTDYMWNRLERRLNTLSINHIDYLILTHSHKDHTENAHRLREEYGPKVIIHKDEASCLLFGETIIPEGTNKITRAMVKILAKYGAPKITIKSCQYDLLVDKRLDLNDYGFNAYIMHTPGHSPGSISVIVDDEIAIVGDAMFGVFRCSVFPPFAVDEKQLVESWGKMLETKCSVFLPSHGSENTRKMVQKDYKNRIRHY